MAEWRGATLFTYEPQYVLAFPLARLFPPVRTRQEDVKYSMVLPLNVKYISGLVFGPALRCRLSHRPTSVPLAVHVPQLLEKKL
jgi:hypothetical protein